MAKDLTQEEIDLLNRIMPGALDSLPEEPHELAAVTEAFNKLAAARKPTTGKRGPNRMPKGSGSIFRIKRGDHTYWCGQVQVHVEGKRRYRTITRKRKSDVVKEMDELRRRAGVKLVGPDQTVADLLTEFIDVKAPKLAPKTLKEYRQRVERMRPHIGDIKVRKLTAQDVRDMMAAFAAAGVAANTANHTKSTLYSALKWAVGEKRISDNPAAYVDGLEGERKLDDDLSQDAIDAVLTAAKADRLYALLYLSATLGVRQGEALGLRWSDVDLDAGDHGEMRVDMSKTRAGERTLPLVGSSNSTLRQHRERQEAERAEAGDGWHDNDLVFAQPDGRPIGPRDLTRWWHGLQKAAGIEPRRRWHALRHSAAQRMLALGVPLDLVSIVLGHSGIGVTSDVYGRGSKDAVRRGLGRYFPNDGDDDS